VAAHRGCRSSNKGRHPPAGSRSWLVAHVPSEGASTSARAICATRILQGCDPGTASTVLTLRPDDDPTALSELAPSAVGPIQTVRACARPLDQTSACPPTTMRRCRRLEKKPSRGFKGFSGAFTGFDLPPMGESAQARRRDPLSWGSGTTGCGGPQPSAGRKLPRFARAPANCGANGFASERKVVALCDELHTCPGAPSVTQASPRATELRREPQTPPLGTSSTSQDLSSSRVLFVGAPGLFVL
jgi:hypothetical protein